MKLFGGSGRQLHSGKPKPNKPEKSRLPLGEQFRALAHSPAWRKLRLPLIALGCVILFILVALLIYALWEKPPEPTGEIRTPAQVTAPPMSVTLPPATEQPAAPQTLPPATQTPEATDAPKTGRKEDCYTFVFLGYDESRANTDTILVGRLDAGAGTLDFVNIPRDTLVNVSWGVKWMNTVLASERGDPGRFLEHLGNLTGFTVDCYAFMNFKAVEKLVDCIGGVYYNVPRDMDYDDPTQDLYIHIPKGEQKLNGEEAVKVLRFCKGNNDRGYTNGDMGRIETQQDFLKAILTQFLTVGNIPNLSTAIDIIENSTETNMTANNMAYFAREFLEMKPENITFQTMPGRGVLIRGGAYWEIAIDDWVEIVNADLNPFYHVITADSLNILQANGEEGAVSTTGEVLPLSSFLDFKQYR